MTAYVLAITSLETGRRLGAAVVCPEARYAAIAAAGASRLSRPFVLPTGWLAIEREIREQLPAGPLPATSAFVQALGLSKDQALQYASIEPLGETDAQGTAAALDARAWAEVAAPKLELA